MLFKLSNLNSNLALTLGYLNPALNNSAQAARKCFKRSRNPGGGGGRRVLQFQVTGMIEWGQKLKPKKKTEKNHMPSFRAIKFPKSIKINNDISNYHKSSDCFEYSKKSPLTSSCAKNYLLKISYHKKFLK